MGQREVEQIMGSEAPRVQVARQFKSVGGIIIY